ncbi:SIR2 family protein [Kocuria rhizophila]|uniref:SIR2 family protein n=1 Tax=Kocuria rhizophila TaxID=72000 RepID=UPI001DDBB1F0|nr:SIR2 family protein [Kocuria rhizophila]MCC5672572.1 SIR2 family protein [Kocuria rhizophila]
MTNSNWPNGLIDAMAKGECVLFIGAGFTKNATSTGANPVSWAELLTELLNKISPNPVRGRRTNADAAIAGQIKNGDLLWAAQALETRFTEAGWHADYREIIARAVDGPVDAKFQPGLPHESLLNLDARLIITTNYDKVLERLFGDGYVYLTYKNDNIAESVRTGKSIVLKLHGTTDDPQGLILTRLDFAELRRKGVQALGVVEALALTRTVLFLGYSLDDPDLQLILENQMLMSSSTPGHYLLTSSRATTAARVDVMRKAFGVQVITYSDQGGEGFSRVFQDLVEEVLSTRAKFLGNGA